MYGLLKLNLVKVAQIELLNPNFFQKVLHVEKQKASSL
jgi:hypothetical protein